MDFMDAIQWLNEIGGTWSVGATPTICVVIVAVGAFEVAVPAGQLRGDQVHLALVQAVQRVRRMFGDGSTAARLSRKTPAPVMTQLVEEEV